MADPDPRLVPAADLAAYNRTRRFLDRGVVCHVPFKSIYWKPGGEAIACCPGDTYVLGTYPRQSIGEIWEGRRLRELRRALLSGDMSLGCGRCLRDLSEGRFRSFAGRFADHLPYNRRQPTAIEFQIGNTCNLECIMCYGEYSSAIRKNRENLPPLESPYGDDFVEDVARIAPGLAIARMSGGEPFLMEIYHRLWEEIAARNPRCRFRVTTNGTIFTRRVEAALSRSDFELCVSLDALNPAVFASIRVNAALPAVLENIELFRRYALVRGTSLSLSFCLIRQNWRELPGIVLFANDIGAFLAISPSWHPEATSIRTWPAVEIRRVLSELSGFDPPAANSVERRNRAAFREAMSTVADWLCEARALEEEISWDEFRALVTRQVTERIEMEALGLPPGERARARRVSREKLTAVFDGFSGRRVSRLHEAALYQMDMTGTLAIFTEESVESLKARLETFLESPILVR